MARGLACNGKYLNPHNYHLPLIDMKRLQASVTFYGTYLMMWRTNQLRCGVLHAITAGLMTRTLQIDWQPRPSLVLSRSAGIGANTFARRTFSMWTSTRQGRTTSAVLWSTPLTAPRAKVRARQGPGLMIGAHTCQHAHFCVSVDCST
jgi:hypothetical protein